jgi:hypothetical protein
MKVKRERLSEYTEKGDGRFLLMLHKNKNNDKYRKQLIADSYIRRTKSLDTEPLPGIIIAQRMKEGIVDKENSKSLNLKVPIRTKKTMEALPELIKKKRINFDLIKEKIKKEAKSKFQKTFRKPLEKLAKTDNRQGLFLSNNNSMKKANFCDFFDPSIFKLITEKRMNLIKKELNFSQNCLISGKCSKYVKPVIPDRILQKRKSMPLLVPLKKDPSEIFSRNSKSLTILKLSTAVPQRKTRLTCRVNKKDSLFINQYFNLKNQVFNKTKNSTLNDRAMLVQVNSFVFQNNKSYWMKSIDQLLSLQVIDQIRYGYYRHKDIKLGGFKLMGQVERILYFLQTDLRREAFEL